MQQKVINYLIKKKLDMVNQENALINEKCKLRELGKYRKINNVNENILISSARIKSLEFLIVFIANLIFKNEVNSVSEYLSPYGVFCDRTNFYYEKNVLDHYNDDYIVQIIMCEIFNCLQDYFIKSELSDIKKLKYRGRSLICLHHIGIISENISLCDADEKIIENFYNKYPSIKIITYEPNEKAAKYLFNKLIWDEDDKLGSIIEKWELSDCLTLKIRSKKIYITEKNGIELLDAQLEDRKIYFIKQNGQYKQTTFQDPIIVKNKDIIEITKKLTE